MPKIIKIYGTVAKDRNLINAVRSTDWFTSIFLGAFMIITTCNKAAMPSKVHINKDNSLTPLVKSIIP
jgi:hypothetical protein